MNRKLVSMLFFLLLSFFIPFPFGGDGGRFLLAQNDQVNWSVFSAASGLSNSANSSAVSSAGESFVGTSSNGSSKIISGFLVYTSSVVTDVKDERDIIPAVYKLNQNYPNPFNPSTVISWQLPVSSHISIKIYDILGSGVANLLNETMESGSHEIQFNSARLASGIYFYRLEAYSVDGSSKFVDVKKMTVLK